jgi:peptide/nickel transport system substrate-binding protein
VRGVRGWRWLAALAALAIAVAAVVLLRTADPEDEPNQQGAGIREGGTVRFATTDEPSGFNPNTSKDDSTAVRNIVVTVYPSVFRVHPDFSVRLDQSFMAGAELTSQDPQTITYRIRQDASWSDGVPITADDFQYLWEHANGKNPKIDVASTSGYDRIKQVTGSADGKTVTAVFNQRFADWQRLFANLLPAHHVRQRPGGWNRGLDNHPERIPSGGPFKIAGFTRGEAVTLVRNDNYWGPRAHLDAIEIRLVQDSDAQIDALRNDEADVIDPQSTADIVNRVRRLPGVGSQADPTLGFEQLTFNLKHPILGELAVRRAIATAMNTEQLVDRLLRPVDPNAQVLGNRIWLTGQQHYQDHADGYGKGDTQAAKRLLEQAGWTLGGDGVYAKGGERLELRYSTLSDDSLRRAEGELLQAQLADAGIQLRIAKANINVLFDWISKGDFEIADFAWFGSPFAISGGEPAYRTGSASNFGKFSNPKVEALFQQALGELDPARAAAIGNQIDQQLWNQLPTIPLYQVPSFLAWHQDLVNVADNPTAGPFWNAGSWGFTRS